MNEVAGVRPDEQSRPEDATTLEEFTARRDAELARLTGAASTWGDVWRVMLIFAVSFIDVYYWDRLSRVTGTERWHRLALALLFLCAWVSAISVFTRRLAARRERRRELERLRLQWQAKAGRG
jgi:hypothetical protein